MSGLTIVIPSRGRPTQAARLLDVCAHTCTTTVTCLVAVDANDPTAGEYIERCGQICMVLEPEGHVRAVNYASAEALRLYQPSAIVKLDDDHYPRTLGWDERYLAALGELGSGIVYGNDLFQGELLPTAPGITADIVKALGYMAPPGLRHLYCDNFWYDIGLAADCLTYLPDVIMEHRHPLAGKAPMDDGYQRVNNLAQYDRDHEAYLDYVSTGFPWDVAVVKALRAEAVRR